MVFSQVAENEIPQGNATLPGLYRAFIVGGQYGIISPGDRRIYKGRTTITDALGGAVSAATPQTAPSDRQDQETYNLHSAPGEPQQQTFSFTQSASAALNEGWWSLFSSQYPFHLILPGGATREKANSDSFDHMVLVEDCRVEAANTGSPGFNLQNLPNNVTSDVAGTGSYETQKFRIVGTVGFQNLAPAEVTEGIKQVAVRDQPNGKELFALHAFDTGTAKAKLIAIDIFGNVESVTIEALTDNTIDIDDMALVGANAVIVTKGDAGHIAMDLDDAIEGTDNSVLITTGYVAAKLPNAVWAKSSSEIYFAGDGGYLYKAPAANAGVTTIDPGVATTANLGAIHGLGDQIVAGGASNALIASKNNGASFSAVTAPSGQTAEEINAVWILKKDVYIIGYSDGKMFYTRDFGRTFAGIIHATGMKTINAISFMPGSSAVGYAVGVRGTVGEIIRTCDGGSSWSRGKPYVGSIPTRGTALNAVAAFGSGVDANSVLIGGVAAADGIFARSVVE